MVKSEEMENIGLMLNAEKMRIMFSCTKWHIVLIFI